MAVPESVLVGTFQCLVDQLNDLHNNVDMIRNNLNHVIVQNRGVIPAYCLSNIRFDIEKDFQGTECEVVLFKCSGAFDTSQLAIDADDYHFCHNQNQIMVRRKDNMKFDFRVVLESVSSCVQIDVKKIWVYSVPLILEPIQECFIKYKELDHDMYNSKLSDIISEKCGDMSFKMAVCDIEQNYKFVDIPGDMLSSFIESFWI